MTYCAISSRRPDGVASRTWVWFCTKREYILSIASVNINDYISNLGSLKEITGDILDRRDERILIFLNFFQVYEAYKMAAPSSKACK